MAKPPLSETFGGASRHSSLYLWMRDNHDEFAALLAKLRPPDWSKVAAGLAAQGLTDGAGKAPTRKTAFQTWWKVRRDRAVG